MIAAKFWLSGCCVLLKRYAFARADQEAAETSNRFRRSTRSMCA